MTASDPHLVEADSEADSAGGAEEEGSRVETDLRLVVGPAEEDQGAVLATREAEASEVVTGTALGPLEKVCLTHLLGPAAAEEAVEVGTKEVEDSAAGSRAPREVVEAMTVAATVADMVGMEAIVIVVIAETVETVAIAATGAEASNLVMVDTAAETGMAEIETIVAEEGLPGKATEMAAETVGETAAETAGEMAAETTGTTDTSGSGHTRTADIPEVETAIAEGFRLPVDSSIIERLINIVFIRWGKGILFIYLLWASNFGFESAEVHLGIFSGSLQSTPRTTRQRRIQKVSSGLFHFGLL